MVRERSRGRFCPNPRLCVLHCPCHHRHPIKASQSSLQHWLKLEPSLYPLIAGGNVSVPPTCLARCCLQICDSGAFSLTHPCALVLLLSAELHSLYSSDGIVSVLSAGGESENLFCQKISLKMDRPSKRNRAATTLLMKLH